MVHPAGFDEERSDEEREHRRPQGREAQGNPLKNLSGAQQPQKVKKKNGDASELAKAVLIFFTEIFYKKNGTPGGIRTHDLLLRRQTLYPAELRVHAYRVVV